MICRFLNADAIAHDHAAAAELANLFHLARTALAGGDDSRWARKCWAAEQFAGDHLIPAVRAYKALDRILS